MDVPLALSKIGIQQGLQRCKRNSSMLSLITSIERFSVSCFLRVMGLFFLRKDEYR